MIASTGDSEEQTETRTVLASRMVPAPDGGWDTEVVLTGPLSYAHHAETEMHNGHVLELRAVAAHDGQGDRLDGAPPQVGGQFEQPRFRKVFVKRKNTQ